MSLYHIIPQKEIAEIREKQKKFDQAAIITVSAFVIIIILYLIWLTLTVLSAEVFLITIVILMIIALAFWSILNKNQLNFKQSVLITALSFLRAYEDGWRNFQNPKNLRKAKKLLRRIIYLIGPPIINKSGFKTDQKTDETLDLLRLYLQKRLIQLKKGYNKSPTETLAEYSSIFINFYEENFDLLKKYILMEVKEVEKENKAKNKYFRAMGTFLNSKKEAAIGTIVILAFSFTLDSLFSYQLGVGWGALSIFTIIVVIVESNGGIKELGGKFIGQKQ